MSGFAPAGGTGGSALTPPDDPGENGFVALGLNGDLTYIGGVNVGDVLTWDGAQWIADAPASGLPAGTADGQILRFDGVNWVADDQAGGAGIVDFSVQASGGVNISNGVAAAQIRADFGLAQLRFGANYQDGALSFLAALGDPDVTFEHDGLTFLTAHRGSGNGGDTVTLGDTADYKTANISASSKVQINAPELRLNDDAIISQNGATIFAFDENAGRVNLGILGSPVAGFPGSTDRIAYLENASSIVGIATAADGSFFWSAAGAFVSHFFQPFTAYLVGQNPATTGDVRVSHGSTWVGLSNAAANVQIGDWGVTAANQLTLGGAPGTVQVRAATTIQLNIVNTSRVQVSSTIFTWNLPTAQFSNSVAATATITYQASTGAANKLAVAGQDAGGVALQNGGDLELRGGAPAAGGLQGKVTLGPSAALQVVAGVQVALAQTVVGLCGVPTAANVPALGGDRVVWLADATIAPTTGAPVGGTTLYSTGAVPAWKTGAGDIVVWNSVPAVAANAGALAIPALAAAYMTLTLNGVAYKMVLFLP